MPTANYGGGAGSFPPISSPPPSTGSAGPHILQVIDASTRRGIPRARVRIDNATQREADSGGRLVIPRTLLRPGPHRLVISASTYTEQQLDLVIGDAALLQTAYMRKAGAAPDPVVPPDPVAITLAFGSYVPLGSPSPWAEIDPTSASVATVTSDQPSTDTARSIAASDYGIVCAILSGVSASTAVEWEVAPSVAATGPKALFQAAGPSLIAWFTYVGTPHAAGTYTITATVGAVTYGPITLTIT